MTSRSPTTVRFSKKEKTAIRRAAARAELCVGEWIRMVCRRAAGLEVVPVIEKEEESK